MIKHYSKATDLSETETEDRFGEQLGHVTPNVGGRAAIIRDDGQILLVKRIDDSTWSFPDGYAKPNSITVCGRFERQWPGTRLTT